jgi:hypothetical protein
VRRFARVGEHLLAHFDRVFLGPLRAEGSLRSFDGDGERVRRKCSEPREPSEPRCGGPRFRCRRGLEGGWTLVIGTLGRTLAFGARRGPLRVRTLAHGGWFLARERTPASNMG